MLAAIASSLVCLTLHLTCTFNAAKPGLQPAGTGDTLLQCTVVWILIQSGPEAPTLQEVFMNAP